MAKPALNKAAACLLLQLPTNARKLRLTLEDLLSHLHRAGVDEDLAADHLETAMKCERTGAITRCMAAGCKHHLLFVKEKALFQSPAWIN